MRRTTGWMHDLAFHYESMRRAYPQDRLMIVFDIDGTILDTRYMILSILHAYDKEHRTSHFRFIRPDDIHIHENEIESLLKGLDISEPEKSKIIEWYVLNYWSEDATFQSHKPLHGVLDVIRWFQLQPNTHVGLNTGRTEHLRAETLRVLNMLGTEYRVEFPSRLLHMHTGDDIFSSKTEGLKAFMGMGYRIVAVIDNEPAILKAIAEEDPAGDILLVHADTIFESAPAHIPVGTVAGNLYDITDLIPEKGLPKHIEFVWHGVDDESILRQFLVSNVHWAEMHVRTDPYDDSVIVRRRSFSEVFRSDSETPIRLEYMLSVLKDAGRGVKLDIKEDRLLERVLAILQGLDFTDDQVWINRNINELNIGGHKKIMEVYPGAIKQCPVDALGYLIMSAPTEARRYLSMYSRWGIDRFSVNWKTTDSRRLIIQLQNWGYDVNIYNVPDLEAFLQAALLLPRSITSYFNFPKWFYAGIGAEEGRHAIFDFRGIEA
ncbi:MAG TPA: HAD hydrolase-like protein [Desulfomonilia bacterium]|nr:HAD hydrolase-like protein [Desulfomonilia bacterium]